MNTDKADDLRFLIQQAIAESQLFWQRTNAMLVVQAASVAGISTLLTADSDKNHIFLAISLVISGAGLTSCGIWWQITRMSRYYNHVWFRDAYVVASSEEELMKLYGYSLGFRQEAPLEHVIPQQSKSSIPFTLQRPCGPSATSCVYGLVAVFALVWIGLLVVCWTNG